MIRMATVFSGIGSIEHALKRMGIQHKVVFACDNGDVDILSKNIKIEIEDIEEEILQLDRLINAISNTKGNDRDYTNELFKDLEHIKSNYNYFVGNIVLNEDLVIISLKLLNAFLEEDKYNSSIKKTYRGWVDELQNSNKSDVHKYIEATKAILKVESDYKRVYGKELISSNILETLGIEQKYEEVIDISIFKNNVKLFRGIAENLSMLHERINTSYIIKEVSNIESFSEKKNYVDNLYQGREKQNKVKETYLANYDLDPRHFHWNASFLDGKQYKDKIDLFVGGSPCQSFSLVGKQRGLEDTRGTLFYEYARLVGEIQPKVFIYENVKAVLSNDNGNTWETMCGIFDKLNYTWSYEILNAKDYGIPQNRERLFVVGFRKDLGIDNFSFPKSIELEKTMRDFLLDNVSGKYYLPEKGVAFVTDEKNLNKRYTQINGDIQLCQKKNQQFNWHGDFVFEEINNDKVKLMDDLEKYFLSEKVEKYVMSSGTNHSSRRCKSGYSGTSAKSKRKKGSVNNFVLLTIDPITANSC